MPQKGQQQAAAGGGGGGSSGVGGASPSAKAALARSQSVALRVGIAPGAPDIVLEEPSQGATGERPMRRPALSASRMRLASSPLHARAPGGGNVTFAGLSATASPSTSQPSTARGHPSGPISYSSSASAPNSAPADWLRIELLKRDVRAWTQGIDACVHQPIVPVRAVAGSESRPQSALTSPTNSGQTAQQQQQLTYTPSSSALVPSYPSFTPLPASLVSQLRAAAAAAEGGASSAPAPTLNGVSSSLPAFGSSAAEVEWAELVSRALLRLSQSADFTSSMLATVHLWDIWCVQLGRMAQACVWRSEHEVQKGAFLATFQQKRSQRDPTARFSISELLSSGALNDAHALLAASSPASDSSLLHCLPSLLALLDRFHLLSEFAAYAEGQLRHYRKAHDRNRAEHQRLTAELSMLSAAIQEAAEDRPKVQRVKVEHVHAGRGGSATYAPQQFADVREEEEDRQGYAEAEQRSSAVSHTPPSARRMDSYQHQSPDATSPPPHFRAFSATSPSPSPSFPSRSPSALSFSSSRPSTAATSMLHRGADPSIESLQHEIRVLRRSLEEERRERRVAEGKEQRRAATEIDGQAAALAEAQAARLAAEKDASDLREQLRLQSESSSLSLSRLQLQLSSLHSSAPAQISASFAAEQKVLFESQWAEREAHRDRVEKERWGVHVLKLAEVQKQLGRVEEELQASKQECDALRSQLTEMRHASTSAASTLLARQALVDSDMRAAEATSKAAESNRAKFEETLQGKRAALEKETKQGGGGGGGGGGGKEGGAPSTASSSSSASEELPRLRRELTALRDELASWRSRDAQRQKDFLSVQLAGEQLERSIRLSEGARQEAEERLARSIQEQERVVEELTDKLDSSVAQADELRSSLRERQLELGDARASIALLQSQVGSLRQQGLALQSERQQLSARLVELESRWSTLQGQHKALTKQFAEVQSQRSGEVAALKTELDSMAAGQRSLEALNAALQAAIASASSSSSSSAQQPGLGSTLSASPSLPQLLSPTRSHATLPGSTASPISPAPWIARPLSSSPSQSSLLGHGNRLDPLQRRPGSSPVHHPHHHHQPQDAPSTDERILLSAAHTSLSARESDLARAQQVLAQQKAELAEQQNLLLQASKALLRAGAGTESQGSSSAQEEEQRELLKAIQANVSHELAVPPQTLHTSSLSDRLDRLRLACDAQEQRLSSSAGRSPSPSPSPGMRSPAAVDAYASGSRSVTSPYRSVSVARMLSASPHGRAMR